MEAKTSIKNYYSILNIERSATPDEIKKAFRNLALKWHPDRKPEHLKQQAHDRFVEIDEAYGILSDTFKRKEYDLLYRTVYEHESIYNRHDYTRAEEDIRRYQETAQQAAEDLANASFEVLSKVLAGLGAVAIETGKFVALGEEGIRKQIDIGDRIAIGFCGTILLILIILSFTGFLAPITLPISFLIWKAGKGALFKNDKFVGFATVFESILMFLGCLIGIIAGIAILCSLGS